MKYLLATLLLASLSGVAQAQSGTRESVPLAPAASQEGSGARAGSGTREGSWTRPQAIAPAAPGDPADPGVPSGETYLAPNSGSGTRSVAAPMPYVEQAPVVYAPARTSHCGRVYSVPVQTYYAPRAYYRPHYGRRHRCFGY